MFNHLLASCRKEVGSLVLYHCLLELLENPQASRQLNFICIGIFKNLVTGSQGSFFLFVFCFTFSR